MYLRAILELALIPGSGLFCVCNLGIRKQRLVWYGRFAGCYLPRRRDAVFLFREVLNSLPPSSVSLVGLASVR